MEIALAAIHEAGHSVMQWFVGWVPGEMFLDVKRNNATTAKSSCPHPTVETASAVRKRLLVLFAGRIATQARWPGSANDKDDWGDARKALLAHLQRQGCTFWLPNDGLSLRDVQANAFVQSAREKCVEIIETPLIRAAIDEIGSILANLAQNVNGRVSLTGKDVIVHCEGRIGTEFRNSHPWKDWIERG